MKEAMVSTHANQRYCTRCGAWKNVLSFVKSAGFPICQACKDHEILLASEDLYVCGRCKKPKKKIEFSSHKKSASGLQAWCRECISAYHAKKFKEKKGESIAARNVVVCKNCGADLGVYASAGRFLLEHGDFPIYWRKGSLTVLCNRCHAENHVALS